MSNLTLSELAVQYENDIKVLDAQIKRAKKELKRCKTSDEKDQIGRKIIAYQDMRLECFKTATKLKNYYDKSDKKHYVRHKNNFYGTGKVSSYGNGESCGWRG